MKRTSTLLLLITLLTIAVGSLVYADIPGRTPPRGTVPNPGAQQQELPNITFPLPYNVFEFVVTCMACHGGTIDQTAGHGGNWAGTNMASAARDPIFRANQVIVNNTIKNTTGQDGAGNICFRCHSPNGWLSGRFDPTLNGDATGRTMIQSIILSTDNEGVSCEMCHRATGAVTMKRPDLSQTDPVWNMMAGPVGEWPHAGLAYPAGPGAGNPYSDATLQFHDGMSYGAKYGGNTELAFSDFPLLGTYTGQTYGIYPWWYTGPIVPPPPGMPGTNALGEVIQYNPDGTIAFQFEGGVMPDPLWGAISPEHSTRVSDFVKSPEFCGSCHDLTIPVSNHGMAEQRTYTEWKYSAFGRGTAPMADARCQGCHMPTLRHEYSDAAPVSLNPDPLVSGWYPYAKDRNIGGGTSFHKFAGANRDLPQMMKILYPEVDLEVLGVPTGHDPMIFPGMLSDRGPMWDRAQRNTEIALRDAVSVQITSGPTFNTVSNRWEVKVRVTNNTGHRLPSGYPDGRRIWIRLVVKDSAGNVVYESGAYDPNTATLSNDRYTTTLTRALTPTIDSGANAVMMYEKRTGTCTGAPPTSCTTSVSLLNDKILFDNRIPPLDYDYAAAGPLGGAFWTYDPVTFVPTETPGRYPADPATGFNQNWDEVTYSFAADQAAVLTARAEVYHQTLSREFVEHLKNSNNALTDQGPRPEGPPNPLDPNYPLTPSYLSESILLTTGTDFLTMTDLNGNALQDNWGGIAYAAWLLTGMGAPYLMAADDTAVAAPPDAPAKVAAVSPIDPVTGVVDPNAQTVSWDAVAGADGYLVWVRYGASDLTSDWDRLAVVVAPQTQVTTLALNPGKTFAYKVQAFNAKGLSADSAVAVVSTPVALPLPPINTAVAGVTDTTVTLTWFDQADNEIGFFIERQERLPGGGLGPWVIIAYVASQTPGGTFGGNIWTDGVALGACVDPLNPPAAGCHTANWTALLPGRTYNYRINAYNASGPSGPDLPVAATTTGVPLAPTGLAATVFNAFRVDLAWTDNSGNETGFRVERALDPAFATGLTTFAVAANAASYSDVSVTPGTTYFYRVFAFNVIGNSARSNVVSVSTPAAPPAAPADLVATASPLSPNPPTVSLSWTENSNNETAFYIERDAGLGFVFLASVGANVRSYVDNTVAPKSSYTYRVAAQNAAGLSAFATSASVVTPGEIPQAPSNLRVTRTTKDSVTLVWADNSNNEQGFYIERSPDGATGWTRAGTAGVNVTTFTNTGLARKTTFWYRVQAFNADGVTAYTATASGATK